MKRILKNIFLKNWGLKLFSFLLALILWLSLIPKEKMFSEKTLTIPLVLHNIPSTMEIVEKPLSTVDVTIRVPNRLINQISDANVYAVLDLQNATVSQTEYSLNESMISIPEGAEVKGVYPSLVELKLENSKEIFLKVKPKLSGNLPEGYEIVKIAVEPEKVLVKGPESKIKPDYEVNTSSIDISGLTRDFEFDVDLINPHPELRLASSQVKVKVRITIQKQTSENPSTGEI